MSHFFKREVITIAKQVKCPICGNMNNKEDTIKINGRYYCVPCGEERQKEIDRNSDGWDDLYQYLMKLCGKVDGKMIALIAKYRKKPYNYTNAGMKLTLYYYYELLEKPTTDDLVGIIPYYYEKAKQEWIINRDIKEYNSTIQLKNNIKRIKIKPEKNTLKRKKNLIDLSILGGIDNE